MKRTTASILFLFVLSAAVLCQTTETFDIATFKPPAGWARQTKDGGLLFSKTDEKSGTYAMIVLYRSDKSSGDAARDFEADWRQFIAGALSVKGNAQMEPARKQDGWTVLTGGTSFESELGASAVVLSTYSGFGTKFSAAALFNGQGYIQAIDAFASSIVLSKPATAPAAAATDNSILGTWGKNHGAHMTYGDPVAAGMAGYSKDQYTFNANGTYSFVSKTFRMAYDKIILVIESGTYQINGNTIAIRPQKSVVQAWSKLNGGDNFGRLLSSQNRKLEAVTYRYTRHYFSGLKEWQLVLQADQPTERDGAFSTFTLFNNAWYYSPISANNPVVELPR